MRGRTRRWIALAAGTLAIACGDGGPASPGSDGGGPRGDGGDPPLPVIGCPALAPAAGNVTTVGPDDAGDLPGIVAAASAGTTLVLTPGIYLLPGTLRFQTAGVTLRSSTDDATDVILDGNYQVAETIAIHASDVTIAHVTVQRAVDHPVHVTPPTGGPDVLRTRLYAVRIVDGGEQFVKVNPNADRLAWNDDGRVECSTFVMTDAGRPMVERNPGGCYTGGIDAHSARGWVVRNNRFESIYCAGEGIAEHAVHFWVSSRDTVVENNTIIDCARGIGFGLGDAGNGQSREYADDPYPGIGYVGHYDGLIRNNVVVSTRPFLDSGIGLEQAHGARVYHNTVVAAPEASNYYSSIDYRFANTLAEVRNNLTTTITQRDGGAGTVEANLQATPWAMFADPAAGDVHLVGDTGDAVDQGVAVGAAGVDIDGEPHTAGAAPDLGADEAP